ncbi:MAG: ADP-ribosylglycohydrolase family protein, partial [Mariniphaga sp.]|nr:ADP-ribosylglycohydrolase family protein [Mariniphaga sp.]
MKNRNLIILFVAISLLSVSCQQKTDTRTISNETLKDKIAGGWAGKMIGVTYGAPTEFKAKTATF